MATISTEYTVVLLPPEEEGEAWGVVVPSLPGCTTQGRTRDEALAMAKDAIRLHIDGLREDGLPIPEEREHPQALTVSLAD